MSPLHNSNLFIQFMMSQSTYDLQTRDHSTQRCSVIWWVFFSFFPIVRLFHADFSQIQWTQSAKFGNIYLPRTHIKIQNNTKQRRSIGLESCPCRDDGRLSMVHVGCSILTRSWTTFLPFFRHLLSLFIHQISIEENEERILTFILSFKENDATKL